MQVQVIKAASRDSLNRKNILFRPVKKKKKVDTRIMLLFVCASTADKNSGLHCQWKQNSETYCVLQ